MYLEQSVIYFSLYNEKEFYTCKVFSMFWFTDVIQQFLPLESLTEKYLRYLKYYKRRQKWHWELRAGCFSGLIQPADFRKVLNRLGRKCNQKPKTSPGEFEKHPLFYFTCLFSHWKLVSVRHIEMARCEGFPNIIKIHFVYSLHIIKWEDSPSETIF